MAEQGERGAVRTWTIGDYPVIARHLLPISVATVEMLAPQPGQRWLDVGTGDGNAAIEAARRGARVTGVDLTPAQIEYARTRSAAEGVDVELAVGDAEQLTFADASFDVVLSVMGVIFAPDPQRALGEMARVTRPGGTVAMTAWAPGGWASAWGPRAARLLTLPASGGPSPEDWGRTDVARERFAAAQLDVAIDERELVFRFASVDDAVSVLLSASGPYIELMELAASQGKADEARAELREVIATWNIDENDACALVSPYLLLTARK